MKLCQLDSKPGLNDTEKTYTNRHLGSFLENVGTKLWPLRDGELVAVGAVGPCSTPKYCRSSCKLLTFCRWNSPLSAKDRQIFRSGTY
jgi:hypothetical protein